MGFSGGNGRIYRGISKSFLKNLRIIRNYRNFLPSKHMFPPLIPSKPETASDHPRFIFIPSPNFVKQVRKQLLADFLSL